MLAILWYFVLILLKSIEKAKLGCVCVQTVSNKCNEMQNCYHSFDAFSSEWYAQNMWQKIWLTFSIANFLHFIEKQNMEFSVYTILYAWQHCYIFLTPHMPSNIKKEKLSCHNNLNLCKKFMIFLLTDIVPQ